MLVGLQHRRENARTTRHAQRLRHGDDVDGTRVTLQKSRPQRYWSAPRFGLWPCNDQIDTCLLSALYRATGAALAVDGVGGDGGGSAVRRPARRDSPRLSTPISSETWSGNLAYPPAGVYPCRHGQRRNSANRSGRRSGTPARPAAGVPGLQAGPPSRAPRSTASRGGSSIGIPPPRPPGSASPPLPIMSARRVC